MVEQVKRAGGIPLSDYTSFNETKNHFDEQMNLLPLCVVPGCAAAPLIPSFSKEKHIERKFVFVGIISVEKFVHFSVFRRQPVYGVVFSSWFEVGFIFCFNIFAPCPTDGNFWLKTEIMS